MRRRFELPIVPVSFFSIVLGLAGLGNTWRVAHRVWQLPVWISECIMLVAATIWAMLLICYIGKWLFASDLALDEVRHPINCGYVGLIGVATMLIANAALPYSRVIAYALFGSGFLFTFFYAVWQTGTLWQGGRDHSTTTAVLYLPTVAGSFVTGAVASSLGYSEWGKMAFGAGMFSWLAIESVLLHRLHTVDSLPAPHRPSLGIQFAPAVVGSVTYMNITSGPPDMFVRALVGYGILQVLVVLRLLPWISQQSFGPSYWAFTFGTASLATTLLRMIERGESGAVAMLALCAFVAANLVIGTLFLATLQRLLGRRLLPTTNATTRLCG